jgi:hypothetical protein
MFQSVTGTITKDAMGEDGPEYPVWEMLLKQAAQIEEQKREEHKKKYPKDHHRYEFDAIEELNKPQYYAWILSNLNYQVNNGGFHQWIDNGYSVEIEDLIKMLNYDGKEWFNTFCKQIGVVAIDATYDKMSFGRVLYVLENELGPLLKKDGEIDYPDTSNTDAADFWKNILEEGMFEELSKLDDRFYEANKPNCEFEKVVEQFLAWCLSCWNTEQAQKKKEQEEKERIQYEQFNFSI